MKKFFLVKILFISCVVFLSGCKEGKIEDLSQENGSGKVLVEKENRAIHEEAEINKQISTSAGSGALAEDSAEWRSYCNQDMLFEIKHPQDWYNSGFVLPEKKRGDRIDIYDNFSNFNDRLYIHIYASKSDEKPKYSGSIPLRDIIYEEGQITTTQINNQQATVHTYRPAECKEIEAGKKPDKGKNHCYYKQRFEIKNSDIYYTLDAMYSASLESLWNQILATFHFLDSTAKCETELYQQGTEIRNNEIFTSGVKKGWIQEDRAFIPFNDILSSFEFDGNIDNMSISGNSGITNYKGLTIFLPNDKKQINYECGQLFLAFTETAVDCETNGKDFLSQYEYKNVGPKMSSEREYPMPWRQVFVKKIGNIDIVFEGELKGVFASNSLDLYVNHYKFLLKNGLIDDVHLTAEEEHNLDLMQVKLESKLGEMRHIVDSAEYLHALQKEAINIGNEEEWREIIESFQIEDIINEVLYF